MRRGRAICVWAAVLWLPIAAATAGAAGSGISGKERLRQRIQDLVRDKAGTLGLAARHLESGEDLVLNGSMPFPMASVFKIPVLVEVLAQASEGKFSLDDEISLDKPDLHLGSGILSSLEAPGITLSMRNLIRLMMTRSDNSATDLLFNMVGADRVNARLASCGIEGIHVDRSCQHLIMDVMGLDFATHRGLSLPEVSAAYQKLMQENPGARRKARENFSRVLMDQSTPLAMNTLLEKIIRREILDPAGCDYILEILLDCETGANRIKGLLPPGTRVAHKTGTICGTVNDAGILFLPGGRGHVLLTVFFKDTEGEDTEAVEERIAGIGRLVFDYFDFTVAERPSEVLEGEPGPGGRRP